MQYDVKTPEAYRRALEADWRKDKLEEVRSYILEAGPELEEGILYKMLAYIANGEAIFGLNAQKGYVSLYVGTIDKVDNGRELLKDFALGKGCIRIRKSTTLSETGIKRFIVATMDIWRDGGNTSC